MGRNVQIKQIAKAFLNGIRLAYRNKRQRITEAEFCETLGDMAVALTSYAIENKNKRIAQYAAILGALLDDMDMTNNDRLKRKTNDRDTAATRRRQRNVRRR